MFLKKILINCSMFGVKRGSVTSHLRVVLVMYNSVVCVSVSRAQHLIRLIQNRNVYWTCVV